MTASNYEVAYRSDTVSAGCLCNTNHVTGNAKDDTLRRYSRYETAQCDAIDIWTTERDVDLATIFK